MNIDSYREFLLNNIDYSASASGGREVICRCFECGDSPDPRSRHFYISMPSDDTPSLFWCHKCHCTGVVTHEKLMEWGLFNQEINVQLIQYNKKIMSMDKNKKFKDSDIYMINNTFISTDNLSTMKLKYINNRLGINLSYQDLLNDKIVLNIKDLLNSNRIYKYTRYDNIVDELDQSFMGFISCDNAFINMRNLREGKVNKAIDKRWVNYNIFGKYDNTKRFYIIPNQIDLCNPNRIKIHISEGAFDILSILHNLRKDKNHNIYAAVCGSNYITLCRYFISTLKLINIELHIYPDNDIQDYVINNIIRILEIFNIPLYIHKNMCPNQNDFGVDMSKINEQVQRVI